MRAAQHSASHPARCCLFLAAYDSLCLHPCSAIASRLSVPFAVCRWGAPKGCAARTLFAHPLSQAGCVRRRPASTTLITSAAAPAAAVHRHLSQRHALRGMQFSEQAVLLLLVNVVCAAWAAARLWSRHVKVAANADGGVSSRQQAQPGQRWRIAAVAWLTAALVGHLGHLLLSAVLAGGLQAAHGLPDGLSCLLAAILLVRIAARRSRVWFARHALCTVGTQTAAPACPPALPPITPALHSPTPHRL